MNGKRCNPPVFISPEGNIYWKKAIYKNSDSDTIDLIFDLIKASGAFYHDLIKFLRFISNNPPKDKDKICQLNIAKTGFHFCSCFTANRPKKATKPFAFLISFENQSIGCADFNLLEINDWIRELESDFSPITKQELAQAFN